MKKRNLLTALCLTLFLCCACGAKTDPTTAAPLPPVTETPTEAATLPPLPSTEPPMPKVLDYVLEAPEGFTASVVRDDLTVLVSPDAPDDTSSIRIEVLPMDGQILARSEADLKAMLLAAAEEAATEPADSTEATEASGTAVLDLITLQLIELDGWPAQFCEYNLIRGDDAAHVLRFEAVVNEANYIFTFTDTTDKNNWLEAFERVGDSIDFLLDSESISLNYTDLYRYDLDCGLRLYAEPGMEVVRVPGATGCIANSRVVMLAMADDKMSHELSGMDLQGYADFLCRANGFDAFRTDLYGNLYTTFSSTDDSGAEYYNVLFVKDTDQDFWVCQFACAADHQAAYARSFPLWASSITVNP